MTLEKLNMNEQNLYGNERDLENVGDEIVLFEKRIVNIRSKSELCAN